MDLMKTFVEKAQVQILICLVRAYISCGEFLKAKAAHETCRSFDIGISSQTGTIEERLCNYEATIAHYRKLIALLQMQEHDDISCSLSLANTLVQTTKLKHLRYFRKSLIVA